MNYSAMGRTTTLDCNILLQLVPAHIHPVPFFDKKFPDIFVEIVGIEIVGDISRRSKGDAAVRGPRLRLTLKD